MGAAANGVAIGKMDFVSSVQMYTNCPSSCRTEPNKRQFKGIQTTYDTGTEESESKKEPQDRTSDAQRKQPAIANPTCSRLSIPECSVFLDASKHENTLP